MVSTGTPFFRSLNVLLLNSGLPWRAHHIRAGEEGSGPLISLLLRGRIWYITSKPAVRGGGCSEAAVQELFLMPRGGRVVPKAAGRWFLQLSSKADLFVHVLLQAQSSLLLPLPFSKILQRTVPACELAACSTVQLLGVCVQPGTVA